MPDANEPDASQPAQPTDQLAEPSPLAEPSQSGTQHRRWGRRGVIVILALLGVVIAAGVGYGVWRITRGAPEAVTLEAAVEGARQVENNTPATLPTSPTNQITAPTPSTTTAPTADSSTELALITTWVVDTEFGTFDYESATGSFAGFRVEEELVRIGSVTAVGRTGEITGTLTVRNNVVTEASFEVDLSTITTNDGGRDRAVYRALNTGEHPIATFVLSEAIDLGDTLFGGGTLSATVNGSLKVNNITQPAEFQVEAQVVGERVVLVGSTMVTFADFDVTVPSAGIVARADDFGVIEFQLLFKPA